MRVILDYIFDWLPFGFGVPILIATGFVLLADEFKAFKAARVCFYLATAWIYGKVVMWAYFSSDRFQVRDVVAFLVFGFVGVGLIEALRLTIHREQPPQSREAVEGQGPGTNTPKKPEAPPSSAGNQSQQDDKQPHDTTNKKKAKPKVAQNTQGNNSPNIGSVTQGSGSALSVGQQGGVTAGTYIGSPPPQFSALSKISENVSDGSLYETKFRVQVVTSQPITFHVKVTAQQIEDVRIDNERPPEQGGMSFQSTSQTGNGWMQNNYLNIESGAYFIIIRTHLPQEIQLAYW
jgi:hypothetical protein